MDPIFTKAYKLMFSDEPDSAEQLRAMLDDALRQKYGTHKTLSTVLPKKLMVEETAVKQENSVSPSPADAQEEADSEESHNSPDNNYNELNILEDEDLLCIVCRQMDQMESNRLVECQDCHSLYHQECHQPPISESDVPVNDPRFAWYCASCKKNLNKAMSSLKSNKPAPATTALPVPTPIVTRPSPPIAGKPPFTSSKTFASSSSSKTSASPSKVSAPVKSSLSSGTGTPTKPNKPASSTSKVPTQNMSMISADKRLQLMKKKAAAASKNQDKKK